MTKEPDLCLLEGCHFALLAQNWSKLFIHAEIVLNDWTGRDIDSCRVKEEDKLRDGLLFWH